MSLQFLEALHWSLGEVANIRQLVSRWKARLTTEQLQAELVLLLPFSFQSTLFVQLIVSPTSASAEIQGNVFHGLEVLLFDLFGWENESQVTSELCAIYVQ